MTEGALQKISVQKKAVSGSSLLHQQATTDSLLLAIILQSSMNIVLKYLSKCAVTHDSEPAYHLSNFDSQLCNLGFQNLFINDDISNDAAVNL